MFQPIKGINAGYQGDSGLDINPDPPPSQPVILPVDSKVIYSEGLLSGDKTHTPWVAKPEYPHDTPGCILVEMAHPLKYKGKSYYYLWFAHLSKLNQHIRDGIDQPTHYKAGHVLGMSGTARSIPHLHFGILTDRRQEDGQYMEPSAVANVLKKGLLK